PGGAGTYQMFMAEYNNVFLDAQFEGPREGFLYKFEGVRVVRNTFGGSPEDLKSMGGIGWIGSLDIRDLGNNKERYRWQMMLRNNRAHDVFDPYIAMAKVFSLNGAALEAAVEDVMDVDAWMRTFALASLAGIGDMYTQGNPHNLSMYARPSDHKIVPFPWDWDFTFQRSATSALWGGKNLSKIIARPIYTRLFHCHLYDLINTVYNTTYMDPWLSHYAAKLNTTFNYSSYIDTRRAHVLSLLPPQIPFTIAGSTNVSVDADFATVQGNGWIDVSSIRLANASEPLEVTWLDADTWTVSFAVNFGTNNLVLEAYDHQGNRVGSNALTVVSTVASRPLQEDLRISEV
ncbi:MAG: CotH kinase family protein, partial [Verrucomicrobiota bacterium]